MPYMQPKTKHLTYVCFSGAVPVRVLAWPQVESALRRSELKHDSKRLKRMKEFPWKYHCKRLRNVPSVKDSRLLKRLRATHILSVRCLESPAPVHHPGSNGGGGDARAFPPEDRPALKLRPQTPVGRTLHLLQGLSSQL